MATPPDRIVSLVPSTTETLHTFGIAGRVIGVTEFCVHGAPESAERIGGTKNPDVERIIALAPDLVFANTEENKPADLERLRDAGLTVEEQYPRKPSDVPPMLRRMGELLGTESVAETHAAAVETAREAALAGQPETQVMALTLVWRKPWMGAGPGTYVDGLLADCGFGNVLSGFDEPYPTLDPVLNLGADVVLLPSEPYAFGPADTAAVTELAGPDAEQVNVDGEDLTWHGPRTAAALRTYSALARRVARTLAG